MKTLERFGQSKPQIPLSTVWLLNELAEYRGKQELFTRQSPQRLKRLMEHSVIESAVASNRIEGVEIEQKRVGTVIFGKSHLYDRNEEEVRGYQEALAWIHGKPSGIPLNTKTILRLHKLSHPKGWDSGKFKEADGEIIETFPDGRVSVRFKPLSARETPTAVDAMCSHWDDLMRNEDIPPLVLWAAQNLDFLCIHPFRDGNGRVSRLLLLLSLYHLGYTAGRYISLERIIEQGKDRYYATLQESSQGWHDGKHDLWPYVNYLLHTLKTLYQEFEARYESTHLPPGEKTEVVQKAIQRFPGPFHVGELQKKCPEVSLDMIRKVLKNMRIANKAECLGRGKHARWQRIG